MPISLARTFVRVSLFLQRGLGQNRVDVRTMLGVYEWDPLSGVDYLMEKDYLSHPSDTGILSPANYAL